MCCKVCGLTKKNQYLDSRDKNNLITETLFQNHSIKCSYSDCYCLKFKGNF
jgi:hypothetical protein